MKPTDESPRRRAPADGVILMAPHHFPDTERERATAAAFGRELVVARDIGHFRATLPNAAVVMMTSYAELTAADFDAMGRCFAVVRYGIGYDNIDVEAARSAGIPVANVPDSSSDEVASHAVAMALALVRRLPAGDAAVRARDWAGNIAYDAPPLANLDVGVLGTGRIGRRVVEMFTALGMHVRAFDPIVEQSDGVRATLDEVLFGSDLVSLHLPLTNESRGLVSRDVLARMRRGVVLINVARGGLVDEVALADALQSGHVGGAGLDTFAVEPMPPEHPLRSAPNLILTPHIAWRSSRSVGAMQSGTVERVRQALSGEAMTDVVY